MKRGEMVTSVFHDYRVTRATDGLVVEVLDYHAGPLKLTHDRLAEFGFVPAQQGRPTPSKHMETGDELAVLADRAIDLLEERLSYESRASAEIEELRRRLLHVRPDRGGDDPGPPAAS